MLWLVHHLLLKFPPEFAHHVAVCFLKIYQYILPKSFVLPQTKVLSIKIKGLDALKFPNRLGLAAGFDKNAECFASLSRVGFGFIEVGTVTPLPQTGNPKPRLWRVAPQGLINQMGFNNCGVEEFKKNILHFRSRCIVPILANIGKNKSTSNESALKDYQQLFKELENEVDGFVINLSSPNTEGLRDLQSVEFLEKLEAIAPSKAIWVKLAPDLSQEALTELLEKIRSSSKLTGCVLTNTSRKIALEQYQRMEGGYSGTKLFETSLERVGWAAEILKGEKTLVAIGGVDSTERALKMRRAGADLVEVYTAFVYQGAKFVKTVASALAD